MTPLSLELFTGAVHDVERTQYQILGGLKQAHDAFAENRVYPTLGKLVRLYQSLKKVIAESEAFRTASSGRISGIDWEAKTVEYEWPEFEADNMAVVEELIQWALPRIQAAIEEGRAIYEFVDEQMGVEEVGIVPSYRQEGYLMVPDCAHGQLHVLRYTLSIFTDDGERYRTLRTVHIDTKAHDGVEVHPSTVKLDLIRTHKDLPNPATYFVDTDLAFPYKETVLPVVKRKLMRHLAESR